MEPWLKAELNYVRVLRHPCLVSDLQTREYPHGPAHSMVSQPTLPRLRSYGRGTHSDP